MDTHYRHRINGMYVCHQCHLHSILIHRCSIASMLFINLDSADNIEPIVTDGTQQGHPYECGLLFMHLSMCLWTLPLPLGGHSHTWRWWGTFALLTPIFDIFRFHWVPFYAQLDLIGPLFRQKKSVCLHHI